MAVYPPDSERHKDFVEFYDDLLTNPRIEFLSIGQDDDDSLQVIREEWNDGKRLRLLDRWEAGIIYGEDVRALIASLTRIADEEGWP